MTNINTKQAAHMLGCSTYKLEKDRVTGNGIPFIKVGRIVRYRLSDIEAYLVSRRFTSTAQY